MKRLVAIGWMVVPIFLFSQPKDGTELISMMHNEYKGKWYTTLTFEQKSIFYKDGKVDHEETWYEAMRMPTGLIIKVGSIEGGTGFIFKNDSQFVYRDNALASKTRRVHDLLVLGFSVYVDDPSETIRKLEESGFDLSRCSREQGEEGDSYVVGEEGKARFWVSADKMLFTKMTKLNGRIEVQFNNYQPLGKGWIATEVVFLRGGQIVMKEEYSDISIERAVPDAVLEGIDFQSARW